MKKFIIILLILIGLGVVYYFAIYRITKQKAINILMKANQERSMQTLSGLADDFLISWASATRRESPDFSYNGNTYVTSTGKKKTV